ncbi:MAG: Aspartate carbamoyltransferase [Candidatus Uhrbacteria bacterium GW2011_GWA2_53_10]|uniref:Aspartate carbamoyltransferase n=1 Tax=Candidatus Uhrbacteria bacterium GW2011_GWA2_53_10 TaxID=1618980 RepID=A0A0G1ZXI7_9BACT|nr:MAG: Aspartate carbamoyltransferase [Candidatus Uhrbacteria bacterium GW2011_GWA2_53_10]
MKHIVSSGEFERPWLDRLFRLAQGMQARRGKPGEVLIGKLMVTLFYEASTRTRMSFEAAMRYLGGMVSSTENAGQFSSAIKGETLEDSIRVVSGDCDVIVIRHPMTGAAARASLVSRVPIINAGDGVGEHPTQALLDVYTLLAERRLLDRLSEPNVLDGLTVTMFGDLKNGRTVHSLARLLRSYGRVHLNFVSPHALRLPGGLLHELSDNGVGVFETDHLSDVLAATNVLYVTRVQKERFDDPKEYEIVKSSYRIDLDALRGAKDDLVIMHPLPRVDEIAPTVDALSNAAYFRQADNGLPVRMALLQMIFQNRS